MIDYEWGVDKHSYVYVRVRVLSMSKVYKQATGLLG